MIRETLLENIRNFLQSAELVYSREDYTSATILFFKAFFLVLDLVILQKLGKTPKDHSERFQILKKNFHDLYEALDKIYSVYRDTYTLKVERSTCDKVKENVESVIKKYKVFE